MEDTVSGADKEVYVPDGDNAVTLDPEITLPGFKVGKPTLTVANNTYPTNFGDISEPKGETYSRVILSIPVTRPVIAMSVKTFVPIVLIVVCAALVFFVRPRYVEGRIGLGITALLTLVALQLTSGAALPDVDYLMMLDKIYLLAYLFIILALARVVATSWRAADTEAEPGIARRDRIFAASLPYRLSRGQCRHRLVDIGLTNSATSNRPHEDWRSACFTRRPSGPPCASNRR